MINNSRPPVWYFSLTRTENKYVIYNCWPCLEPPQNLLRKQNKAIPMLFKALFAIRVRVKGLYELILEYKNEASQLKKVGVAHA